MVVCKCVYFGECLARMLVVPQSLRGEIVVGGEPSLRYLKGFTEIAFVLPAIFNIKTLKGRLIAHKFNTGWAVGVVKSVVKKKSVACQFAVKCRSETYCWTQKLNKEEIRN